MCVCPGFCSADSPGSIPGRSTFFEYTDLFGFYILYIHIEIMSATSCKRGQKRQRHTPASPSYNVDPRWARKYAFAVSVFEHGHRHSGSEDGVANGSESGGCGLGPTTTPPVPPMRISAGSTNSVYPDTSV